MMMPAEIEMEQEFDKSIDSLMRTEARRGGFVSVTESPHLDADEIGMFAENALPEMARVRATGHLADCDGCRTMLSNVINLNSAEESEIVHSPNEKAVVTAQPVPWYQRLFALPKITYAMTGLALLFTAAIAFIAINNNDSLNSSVAQKDDAYSTAPKGVSGASSEGEGRLAENASTSNASASNSTANTASNAANAPSTYPVSSSEEPPPGRPPLNGPSGTPGDITLSKDPVTGTDKDSKIIADEPKPTLDGVVTENKRDSSEVTKSIPSEEYRNRQNETERSVQKQEQNVGQNQSNIIMPDTGRAGKAPAPAPVAATQSRDEGAREDDRRQKKAAPAKEKRAESKTVGGKTFQNIGGVWTDTSYPGGSTKTVKRGSDQYKKLDSGLQSIGNSFSGTVIVVWGGKNYKIQ